MVKEDTPKKHYLRLIIVFIILFLGLTFVYARYIGTKGLEIKEYIITNEKLADNFDNLKIVHFSDLHYGTTVFLPEVENLVKEINKLKPDLIFFTGDLIDVRKNISEEEIKSLLKTLNLLKPNIGMYAVKGNHDQGKYASVLDDSNFEVLANTNELFYFNGDTPIVIAGLEDYFVGHPNIEETFANLEKTSYYTILLSHEPDMFRELKGYNVDLLLSGHSHGGQVRLPFIGALIKNDGALYYYDDYYHEGTTDIYVSSGIGTSVVPMRFLNKPSINFYRFMTR